MIGKLQQIIDESDPFLVEAYEGKTADELYHIMTRLQKELSVIQKMRSVTWVDSQRTIITSVNAMYQLQMIKEDKVDGGHSVV